MYPLLILAITGSENWKHNTENAAGSGFHRYDPNGPRPNHLRMPVTTYVRTQVFEALKIGNRKLSRFPNCAQIRWRIAMRDVGQSWNHPKGIDGTDVWLELYTDQPNDKDWTKPLKLLAEYPVTGDAFKALPILQRIAIELLWRKECNGKDPE